MTAVSVTRPFKRGAGRWAAAALSAVFAAALALGTAPSAYADGDESLKVTPADVTVAAPGPGHEVSWEVRLSGLPDADRPVFFSLDGLPGKLGDGPTPLEFSLYADGVAEPLVSGPLNSLVGNPQVVPGLADGGEQVLRATVRLPREATNDYARESAQLSLLFETESSAGTDSNDSGLLAATGLDDAAAAAVAGAFVTALAVGVVLLLLLRRRAAHNESE